MGPAWTYDEARARLAGFLLRAAEAHERGEWERLGDGFDETEAPICAADQPGKPRRLRTALTFWEHWVDSAYHDWRFHEPFRRDDWPAVARIVAADLLADREITHPAVLADTTLPPPPGWLHWLRRITSSFRRSST